MLRSCTQVSLLKEEKGTLAEQIRTLMAGVHEKIEKAETEGKASGAKQMGIMDQFKGVGKSAMAVEKIRAEMEERMAAEVAAAREALRATHEAEKAAMEAEASRLNDELERLRLLGDGSVELTAAREQAAAAEMELVCTRTRVVEMEAALEKSRAAQEELKRRMASEMKELQAVNAELRREIEAYHASAGKHGDPVAEARLKAKAEALEAQIGKVKGHLDKGLKEIGVQQPSQKDPSTLQMCSFPVRWQRRSLSTHPPYVTSHSASHTPSHTLSCIPPIISSLTSRFPFSFSPSTLPSLPCLSLATLCPSLLSYATWWRRWSAATRRSRPHSTM